MPVIIVCVCVLLCDYFNINCIYINVYSFIAMNDSKNKNLASKSCENEIFNLLCFIFLYVNEFCNKDNYTNKLKISTQAVN